MSQYKNVLDDILYEIATSVDSKTIKIKLDLNKIFCMDYFWHINCRSKKIVYRKICLRSKINHLKYILLKRFN